MKIVTREDMESFCDQVKNPFEIMLLKSPLFNDKDLVRFHEVRTEMIRKGYIGPDSEPVQGILDVHTQNQYREFSMSILL